MASEATIRTSLQIRKGNLTYQSQPTAFIADVAGTKGPVPGAISVSVPGIDVDLSELTTPGLCRIQNLDSTNYVTYGKYDTDSNRFHPLGEILPGETYVLRLSRYLNDEFIGTGTGTPAGSNSRLHLKADTASCNVLIEAFEK